MRRAAALLPVLLLLAAAANAGEGGLEAIPRYLRLSEGVATGAQPELAQFALLQQAGFRTVVNLRQPDEYDIEAEAAAVRDAGLRYISIPVSSADPKSEAVEVFLKTTDDPQIDPVFIHCSTANRVGAFWMIRRVLRDGWSLEPAEQEAFRIGLTKPGLLAFAREYIAAHSKAPVK